jgi:Protein of unknown function (DUF4054)
MNPLTVAQFRLDFPEFANTTTYTDSMIQFWLTLAASLINAAAWGALATQGQELITAHYLVGAVKNQLAAAGGGMPGQVGVVSSKSAGPVSGSYNTELGALEGGGDWNTTSYGQQYLKLARLMGAGVVSVGPLNGLGALTYGGEVYQFGQNWPFPGWPTY